MQSRLQCSTKKLNISETGKDKDTGLSRIRTVPNCGCAVNRVMVGTRTSNTILLAEKQ